MAYIPHLVGEVDHPTLVIPLMCNVLSRFDPDHTTCWQVPTPTTPN